MLPQSTIAMVTAALASLLNQDAIASTESARVQFYIASAIQRVLRAFDYDQTIKYATVTTDSDGRVSLSGLALGMTPGFESANNGGSQSYTYVVPSERYRYTQGSYYYNVVVENGVWVLYSSEKNAAITLGFYESPDTVTDSIKVAFQPMVLAKGALIYYRQAQDPEADTSQEEDQFRQEMNEIFEAQERRRPQRFATTQRDIRGHYLGQTDRGRGSNEYGRRY